TLQTRHCAPHNKDKTMPQMHMDNSTDPGNSDDSSLDELERLLVEGVSLTQVPVSTGSPASPLLQREEDDEDGEGEEGEEGGEGSPGSDVQGAIGLFAEAAQDMATAGVELRSEEHTSELQS